MLANGIYNTFVSMVTLRWCWSYIFQCTIPKLRTSVLEPILLTVGLAEVKVAKSSLKGDIQDEAPESATIEVSCLNNLVKNTHPGYRKVSFSALNRVLCEETGASSAQGVAGNQCIFLYLFQFYLFRQKIH